MTDRFITMKEVCKCTTFTDVWIRKLVKDKKFPAPKKVGERAIRFLESDVQNWIQSQPYVDEDSWHQEDQPTLAS